MCVYSCKQALMCVFAYAHSHTTWLNLSEFSWALVGTMISFILWVFSQISACALSNNCRQEVGEDMRSYKNRMGDRKSAKSRTKPDACHWTHLRHTEREMWEERDGGSHQSTFRDHIPERPGRILDCTPSSDFIHLLSPSLQAAEAQ